MAKWFYSIDGLQHGPVDPAELKRLADAGAIKFTDKVRREDLADWYEARKVKGLFASNPNTIIPSPPAALKTQQTIQPLPAANPTTALAEPATKAAPKFGMKRIALGCGCLLVVCAIILPAIHAAKDGARRHADASITREKPVSESSNAIGETNSSRDVVLKCIAHSKEHARTIGEKTVEFYRVSAELSNQFAIVAAMPGKSQIDHAPTQLDFLISSAAYPDIAEIGPDFTACAFKATNSSKSETNPRDNQVDRKIDLLNRIRSMVNENRNNATNIQDAEERRDFQQYIDWWDRKLDNAHLAEMSKNWSEALRLYTEIGNGFSASQQEFQQLEGSQPQAPSGAFFVGGITHLIQGDVYYLNDRGKNRAVRIPKQYESQYITQRGDTPNTIVVEGKFHFVGNSSGVNAFGAQIPVEMYEVYDDYAKAAVKYAHLREEMSGLRKQELGRADFSTYPQSQEDMLNSLLAVGGRELSESVKNQIVDQQTKVKDRYAIANLEAKKREDAALRLQAEKEIEERDRDKTVQDAKTSDENKRLQAERQQLAHDVFSGILLEPKILLSRSAHRIQATAKLQSPALAKTKELQGAKDWLGLINYINSNSPSSFAGATGEPWDGPRSCPWGNANKSIESRVGIWDDGTCSNPAEPLAESYSCRLPGC